MSIIIQKYGGTSVGSIERIRHVADLIIKERNYGNKVAVIASAMAGATNQLVSLAGQFHSAVGKDAYDFTIATGENISCGLLSLALAEKGMNALPLAGWQIPIRTTTVHSNARITQIDPTLLHQLLNNDVIPVITGFQGLSDGHRITTLGRGGSDTSAVAIAAALKADRCDIYTDIDGIYTADPRIALDAMFIATMSYPTALQMATLGTKIIHPRAVAAGMESNIPIRIMSSFGSEKFTTLTRTATAYRVVGIAHIAECCMVSIPLNTPDDIEKVVSTLQDKDISIDVSHLYNESLQVCAELTDARLIHHLIPSSIIKSGYAKVSVVGSLSEEDATNAEVAFRQAGIETHHAYLDSNRLSLVIQQTALNNAVNVLHRIFFGPTFKNVAFKPEIQ